MKKFIKENWFKVIILIIILIFLFLTSIFMYIQYENFKIQKECSLVADKKENDLLIRCMFLDKSIDGEKKYELYKNILKNKIKQQIDDN